MNNYNKHIIAGIIILCLFLAPVLASDKDETIPLPNPQEKLQVTDQITVTATATKKEVKDCSATVSVLSENEFALFNVHNAINILNSLPGIFVQRTGDYGRADVEMRGLGSNGRRISIMVDGRPEKMGLFGCVVTHSFALDNIAKIEVVRGPSSVIYGPDAMGGVINILTKKIDDGFHTDATLSYGSFNTQHYLVRHGGNINKFNYYITFDRDLSDGHIPNSQYDGYDFTTRLGYSLSPNLEFTLQGKYFAGKKYEPGTIHIPLVDYWNNYKRGAVDFTIASSWQKSEASFKLYRNFGHHVFSDGFDSRDYTNGFVTHYTTRALSNNELTIGADLKYLGGELFSAPAGNWDKNEYGFFFHNEYKLFHKVILSTGLRIHHDSIYGNESSPHIGAVVHLNDNTHIRTSINKGFRTPQLNELFMFPTSNPELEPEKVWNYELGINHTFTPWLEADCTIYRMNGNNLIQLSPNPSPPPGFKFMNTGSFIFKGLEAGLKYHHSTYLEGQFYYTYLDPDENTLGRAHHKFDLITAFTKNKLSTSITLQYVADYYEQNNHQSPMPDFFTASAKFDYQITTKVDAFLAINNIFNKHYLIYVELPGAAAGAYQMPGRTYTFGINFNLKK
ncbi:MAG: hypothetical protein A2Y62_20445 [Candidatus Fischerbacteria bacterium RBG_13_37_8]|uniref:TonB-dependent receptor n=1 Tax=Candidatus Fischerbacteria bacterium RBG_13_37_8 TaxID=1817863 RepID=A0A1F5VX38_9BACT|nr:MAG: hypothetical protein A2Y62_20445 [Candidatus Fischerbacteria bacterium RBG_13_37_8]